MKRLFPIAFALALFFLLSALGSAAAEEIDSVVLASDWHYPDALVAGAAANRIGAPLLLTEPGRMPQETLDEIESLNVSRIYIIGGPYAVTEEVENELKEKWNT